MNLWFASDSVSSAELKVKVLWSCLLRVNQEFVITNLHLFIRQHSDSDPKLCWTDWQNAILLHIVEMRSGCMSILYLNVNHGTRACAFAATPSDIPFHIRGKRIKRTETHFISLRTIREEPRQLNEKMCGWKGDSNYWTSYWSVSCGPYDKLQDIIMRGYWSMNEGDGERSNVHLACSRGNIYSGFYLSWTLTLLLLLPTLKSVVCVLCYIAPWLTESRLGGCRRRNNRRNAGEMGFLMESGMGCNKLEFFSKV